VPLVSRASMPKGCREAVEICIQTQNHHLGNLLLSNHKCYGLDDIDLSGDHSIDFRHKRRRVSAHYLEQVPRRNLIDLRPICFHLHTTTPLPPASLALRTAKPDRPSISLRLSSQLPQWLKYYSSGPVLLPHKLQPPLLNRF
jgi:hypothetical protein